MNNKIIKKKIIEKENLNHNKNNNNNKNLSSNKKNKSCKNLIKNSNNNNNKNLNKNQSKNKNNFPQMNIKKVIKIFNNYNTIVDSNLLINNNNNNNNNNKINSNDNNIIINNNFEEINNIYNNKRIEVKKKLKKNYLHNSSTNITKNLDLNKYFNKKNEINKNIINNNRNISNNFLNNNNNKFTITVNKINNNNNNISRNNNKSIKIHNSNSLSLISNKTFLKTTINFKKSKSIKSLKTPLKSNIIHKINFFHSTSNNNIKKYYNNDLIFNQKNKTSNNSFEQEEKNNIYYNYNSTRNSYKNLLFNNSQEYLKKQINFNNKNIQIKEISFISKAGETISYSNTKKINQDKIFITNLKNKYYNYKFIGVCDGHGEYGHIISNFICLNLPKNLENNLNTNFYKNYNLLLKNHIKNACFYTNSQIINNSNINSILSGSTCSSILFDLNNNNNNNINKLYSINIGDSRSVFFPLHSNPVFLSTDHTPNETKEKERILSFGGRILKFKEFNNEFVGPLRIWLKNEDVPGLAMTRSFGDLIASSVGVICEPEIKEFDVDDEGVVVVGSDGLWEYFEVKEMEKYVKKMKLNGKDSKFMANELERIARQKWRENDEGVDDISVVVVYLE